MQALLGRSVQTRQGQGVRLFVVLLSVASSVLCCLRRLHGRSRPEPSQRALRSKTKSRRWGWPILFTSTVPKATRPYTASNVPCMKHDYVKKSGPLLGKVDLCQYACRESVRPRRGHQAHSSVPAVYATLIRRSIKIPQHPARVRSSIHPDLERRPSAVPTDASSVR